MKRFRYNIGDLLYLWPKNAIVRYVKGDRIDVGTYEDFDNKNVQYLVVGIIPQGGKYWADPNEVSMVYKEEKTGKYFTRRDGKKIYVPRGT